MWISILSGAAAGIVHVLSGPDHLAAVAPFSANRYRRAWIVGLLWGVGHSGGVWIIGVLAFMFREALPIEALSAWSERMVGFLLIAIGLWALRKAWGQHLHYHEHRHDGIVHGHFHVHSEVKSGHHPEQHRHSHAPLGIGILHGLAGSSHLFGILPALMLPTRSAAVAYILAFGLGSILAMSFFSWLLGYFFFKLRRSSLPLFRWMNMGFAMLAIGVGGVWIYITL